MKKYLSNFIILGIAIISFVFIISNVLAESTSEISTIQYPVKELNNCASESDCKIFCDKTENIERCLSFAEKNNLMSKEELQMAKKFANKQMKGPGGCNGKDECDTYCNDMIHIDECISFAEKNNLMPEKEMKEAKKVQAAIKKGIKPPNCKNKAECDIYCEESSHMEECINFGVEAGFIQGKELEDAQKMLSALKRGITPPPCKGKDACDKYCGEPNNMEVCMNFALEAGMMNEQEKENSQKMLQALKKGVKPPNCKGKEECDAFCQSEEHMEECINFSVAAGFMNEKEAEMAKKTKGKGPGGCKNKEECDAFCNNPDNQETCFQFGKDNGMIPEGDLQKMESEKANFKESFNNTINNSPAEVRDCLISNIGSEKIEMFKSGTAMPPREIGDQMKVCFEKYMPVGGPGEGGNIPPGQNGPGTFNPGDQQMPQQTGPGGCKGPEECKAFCEKNPDICKNFSPDIKQEQQVQQINQFNQQPMQPKIESNYVEGQQINQFNQQQPMQIRTEPNFNGDNMQQFPEGQQPPAGIQQPQIYQQNIQQFQPQEQQQNEIPPVSKNVQKQSLLANVLTAFLSLFK